MDKGSVIRILVALFAATNTMLTAFGYPVIPDDVINAVTIVVGYGFTLWAMHKNNYLFKKGQAQAKVLKREGLK